MFAAFQAIGTFVALVILVPILLIIDSVAGGISVEVIKVFIVLFLILSSVISAKVFLGFVSLFKSDVTINVKEPKKYKRRRTIVHGKDMIEEEIEYTDDDDECVDLSDYPEGCAL